MGNIAHGHYLKSSTDTRTPGALITMGFAARTDPQPESTWYHVHLWVANWTVRRSRRRTGLVEREHGTTAEAAAALVDTWACREKSTWLYAHKTGFDLLISWLLPQLTALGWELSSRHALTSGGGFITLHKGHRRYERKDRTQPGGRPVVQDKWAHSLTIADSGSLWNKPLAQLAAEADTPLPSDPVDSDDQAAFLARARAEVTIVRSWLLDTMDWWDANQQGIWSPTGAGLGWQTYRARLGERQVVIDRDPARLAFAHAAIYGGRRDTARVGNPGCPPYGEIDYEAAYPTIAAQCPLPASYGGQLDPARLGQVLRNRPSAGVIADVTITTPVPLWPMRVGQDTYYPTGTFRTLLAGPELKAAWQAGAVRAVHEAHWWRLSRHLAPWASWVLPRIRPGGDLVPAPVRVLLKLASRAVIGKFAQRGFRTLPYRDEPRPGLFTRPAQELYCVNPLPGWKLGDPQPEGYEAVFSRRLGTVTSLDGTSWISFNDAVGDHELPAVLAFIEAHVRSRLSRLLTGPLAAAVVQYDTDGLIVSLPLLRQLAAGRGRRTWHRRDVPAGPDEVLAELNEASWPLRLREKSVIGRLILYGPQHLVTDRGHKLAGVPAGAVEARPGVWRAEVTRDLAWQSANAPPGTLGRPLADFTVTGPYTGGWVTADGAVLAPEAEVDAQGANRLVEWARTAAAASGAVLAAVQARWAAGLYDPGACHANG